MNLIDDGVIVEENAAVDEHHADESIAEQDPGVVSNLSAFERNIIPNQGGKLKILTVENRLLSAGAYSMNMF